MQPFRAQKFISLKGIHFISSEISNKKETEIITISSKNCNNQGWFNRNRNDELQRRANGVAKRDTNRCIRRILYSERLWGSISDVVITFNSLCKTSDSLNFFIEIPRCKCVNWTNANDSVCRYKVQSIRCSSSSVFLYFFRWWFVIPWNSSRHYMLQWVLLVKKYRSCYSIQHCVN